MGYWKDNRNNSNRSGELERSLNEMANASAGAYDVAVQYLDKLSGAVIQAKSQLAKFENEFKKNHYQDIDLNEKLKSDFLSIKNQFESIVRDCESNLITKKKHDSNFNITLFGKTKAGKSTLMAILTHGNDDKIGNGAQRATLDVRSYSWLSMNITDVPGIDAFNGETDDQKAYEAAKNADLILFLITSDPQSNEADWLVKLKKEDKPLLCVYNCKKTLAEDAMDIFLDDPDEYLDGYDIDGIINQFNEFVNDKLPNEKIDIVVVQLQAKYLSEKVTDPNKKQKLAKYSRFSVFEDRIIDDVINNAKFYRQKSYLSLIDAPIYDIAKSLFSSSEKVSESYYLIKEKYDEFLNWKNDVYSAKEKELVNFISQSFIPLDNRIYSFASENVSNKNINKNWENEVKQQKIIDKVKVKLDGLIRDTYNKTCEFFADLNDELKLSSIFSSLDFNLDSDKDFNWRKMWGWASAGVTGALAIAEGIAWLASATIAAPVAIGVAILAGVFGIFGLFSDSEDKKRKKAEQKIREQLASDLKNRKKDITKKAKEILEVNISKILKEGQTRFDNIVALCGSLYVSQHDLALSLNKEHVSITKRILKYVDESYKQKQIASLHKKGSMDNRVVGNCELLLKEMVNVARIPAKRILIAVNKPIIIPGDFNKALGTNDIVEQVVVDKKDSEYNQIYKCINKYMRVRPISINLEKRRVYIENRTYEDTENDYKYLLQQLFNIQIIKR